MSNHSTSALTRTRLTLLEGVSLIVGANIGAGILSLAFGAKNAGYQYLYFGSSLQVYSRLFLALRCRNDLEN